MGSRTKAKSKRRGKRQASPSAEQIERHLEKGDYKQALKDAKVSYRQSPNEYRELIEYAYIGRAQQLARHGNHEAGRAVAEDLLALGVSQPTVQAGLPELFVALGMLDWLSGNADVSADELAALQIQAADHAVLRPDGAPQSMPDIADGARRIRAAIEAIEKGDEDGALSQLKGIARDSPFADWRFLVRGLAAYYRRDTAQMEANWQQLDADRFAARIARPLAVLAGAAPHDKSDAALQDGLTLLDRHLTSQSLQAQLGSLSGAVLDGDWDKALRMLWSLRSGMRQLDERLYARLTRWLCARLVQDGQVAELDRMTRIADPLPLDPHWNRARALVREFSDEVDAGAERPYWQKYLLDVPRVPTLSTNEREVAQGLVWRRLAQDYAEEAGALRRCRCGASHAEDIAEAVERAVHCLEECMRLAPTYAPAYESLADLYEAAEQPQQAADAYRRALDQLPDDTDALRYLTMHHFSVDEPVEAQPYARRLLRLKPLDKGVQSLVWAAHVGAARWYALRGQFEQGRAEFTAADELMPARCADYDALARKAAFEMKAGNNDAAQQLVAAACDSLEEPAPLWLLLTIEANRHELSENEVLLYEKRWTDALKRRCRGATAGAMCKLLHAHLVELTGYRCRQDQLKTLLAYVRRCSRVKWQQPDLRAVCQFLDKLENIDLLKKFVRKGQRQFPTEAFYHALQGDLELRRGSRFGILRSARKCYEHAADLARESNNPEDEAVLDLAKRGLTFVQEAEQHFFHSPRIPFVEGPLYDSDDGSDDDDGSDSAPLPRELRDALADVMEELGITPEQLLDNMEEFDALPAGPAPQQSKSKSRHKKPRK